MRFIKKNFNINNLPKKEIWMGEQDRNGKYNSIALVDIRDERVPNQIYFGQVKDDYFDGLGVKYYEDNINNTYVGKFSGGLETIGVRCVNNSLILQDFKNGKENLFVVNEDGSWAYVEKGETEGRNFRRCVRYLKSKKVLEFAAVTDLKELFSDSLKTSPINFDAELKGSTIWQNLYGCKFEHMSYNSIVGRFDDFVSGNGKLEDGERWEDCAQKVNDESQGMGSIRWEDGNFYFGEWEQGWRTGFGMYYYTDGNYFSFCNYKKGDYFGDLKIEYSVRFDSFSIYFRDIKVHAYFSCNREGSTDSIFGITNDETELSFDVFNDFSVCLFKRENKEWKTIKSYNFSLEGPAPRGGGDNGPVNGENDLINELRSRLNGFVGNQSSSEPSSEPIDAEAELEKLIGLRKVKEKVEFFKASAKKRRGKVNLNFSFIGNPGTGKTVVARLFAQILNKAGLLPTANLVEVSRSNLVGQYIGESEKKTNEIIQRAMGGTLFIDEAYALNVNGGSGNDYGKQVVEILLKVMEDHRGELCIILAGYPDEMHEFFKMNSGFKSRIPNMNHIEFENYNESELRLIAKKMIDEDPDIDNVTDEAFEEIIRLILRDAYKKNFDNARCVRNVLNAVLEKQILRTKDDPNDHNITIEDVRAVSDPVRKPDQPKAEERLNQLIGLAKVKKQILSLKNTVKKFRNMPDRLNLHMAFLGNPGTGKTEVAKLLAEIFYDEGILPTKNLIEVDPSGLIAQYVGQTAPKTHDVVQRALGGVLFIDEAYALDQGGEHNYGSEAIEALLKDMEEYRGKFCVVLAGYTKEMLHLMNTNPGFKSRIPDHNYIEFPDYDPDELVAIAKLMVESDGYSMDEACLAELKKIVQIAKGRKNFENARFVRNILQGIESYQNTRTVNTPEDLTIILQDIIEYEKDNDLFNEDSGSAGKCISQEQLLALPEVNGPVAPNFIIERSVSIHTEMEDGAGEGTGFIVSPDGYIITNNHVIEGGIDVTVGINYILANNKTIQVTTKAEIIAADKQHDVAVIKIEREDEELPYFTLVKPDAPDPRLMSDVIMGGYPLGKSRFHQITLTTGKVQSINRDERIGRDMKYIYLDLSGTHGNSGSAVVDQETARVIGIFSGASVDKDANAEINFAVPTKYIWDLINKANNK